MIRALLVVLIRWLPKARLVGLTDTTVPVPERATVCGLPAASSATERVAVRAPPPLGVNVTLIVQLAPAARVAPHVVVLAKLFAFVPVIVIPVMAIAALPVFDSVTLRAALVTFTSWFPNASDVGDRLATGLVPVPERATV